MLHFPRLAKLDPDNQPRPKSCSFFLDLSRTPRNLHSSSGTPRLSAPRTHPRVAVVSFGDRTARGQHRQQGCSKEESTSRLAILQLADHLQATQRTWFCGESNSITINVSRFRFTSHAGETCKLDAHGRVRVCVCVCACACARVYVCCARLTWHSQLVR